MIQHRVENYERFEPVWNSDTLTETDYVMDVRCYKCNHEMQVVTRPWYDERDNVTKYWLVCRHSEQGHSLTTAGFMYRFKREQYDKEVLTPCSCDADIFIMLRGDHTKQGLQDSDIEWMNSGRHPMHTASYMSHMAKFNHPS